MHYNKVILFKFWNQAIKDFIENSDAPIYNKYNNYFHTDDDDYFYLNGPKSVLSAKRLPEYTGPQLLLEQQKAELFLYRLRYAVNTAIDAHLYPKKALEYYEEYKSKIEDGLPFKLHSVHYDDIPGPTEEPEEYKVSYIAQKPQ